MKNSGNTLRIGLRLPSSSAPSSGLPSPATAQQELLRHHRRLGGMGDKAYHSQLRVEGFVVPGSIEHNGPHVDFTLNEFESHSPRPLRGICSKSATRALSRSRHLQGRFPGLAAGSYGRDGVFHASVLQAKCASKYAPAGPNGAPAKPATLLSLSLPSNLQRSGAN